MTEMDSGEAFWTRERWWVQGSEDGAISRNMLIKRWRATTDLRGLESKTFEGELGAWSGALGRAAWVAAAFGAPAAGLAHKNVNALHHADEEWQRVSRLYAEYGDPLARYTSQLVAMAHARRPVLPHALRCDIREAARRTATASRSLILAEDQSVLATRDTADAFLADTAVRLDIDLKAVIHSYIHRLSEYAHDCSDAEVADAVHARVAELETEFGQPEPEGSKEISAQAWAAAGALIKKELEMKPWLVSRNREVIGVAAEKAQQWLAKGLDAGTKLTHAGIIHLTIRQVSAQEARPKSTTTVSLEEMLESGPGRESVLDGVATAETEHEVEVRLVVAAIRESLARAAFVQSADGEVVRLDRFWEKDIALEILDNRTGLSEGQRYVDPIVMLTDLVRDRWAADAPGRRAVSGDAAQAAKYVEGLLLTAFSQAAHKKDFRAVFAKRSADHAGAAAATRRQARRLADVKNQLEYARRAKTEPTVSDEEVER